MDLYCDRIHDRQLENAVVHALTLMRQGYRPNIANAEAARAYGYATSDVSHYTGQHASRIRAARKSGGRAGNPAATGIRAAQAEVKRLRIERDEAKFHAHEMLNSYSYDVFQNGLDLLIRDANAFQAAQKRLEAAERAVDELRDR